MKRFNPLISIVIPVYNGANYMKEAIDSALSQTYKNIEVVVVNDGSTDGGETRKIAKSYGKRIRYFEKDNGGVASALNYAIERMKGEYFSWLSHDDVYYPQKIEMQIAFLSKNPMPKDIIVYSNYDFIDSKSRLISTYQTKYFTSPSDILVHLMFYSDVHGCTLLIPKKCFTSIGCFNEKLRVTQDYELWFRLGMKYQFHFIPDILVHSRLHQEQDSIKKRNIHLDESEYLYSFFLDTFPPPLSDRFYQGKMYYMIAMSFKKRGYILSSEKAFSLYLNYNKDGKYEKYFYRIIFVLYSHTMIQFFKFIRKNIRNAMIKMHLLKYWHACKKALRINE